MSERIGRTRIKLTKILNECLDLACEPEDLKPSGGRARNNTSNGDMYAWEVFGRTKTGQLFVAGSFDTMGDCVKAGKVFFERGEICAGEAKQGLSDKVISDLAEVLTDTCYTIAAACNKLGIEEPDGDEVENKLLNLNVECCKGCGWWHESYELVPDPDEDLDEDEWTGLCRTCRDDANPHLVSDGQEEA